jgi:anti-anti-sigma factor
VEIPVGDIFDAIRRAQDAGGDRVRLDFSNVLFMTSAMIEKLLRARESANLAGIDIVIDNASPNVREVFNITKLGELFKFEGEDE